ncbi:MAG: ATPase [Bacteroidales bacterium]
MILVADSGSTKTEWVVISDGKARESLFTGGINPFFLNGTEILKLLIKELDVLYRLGFIGVWFYGTGINSEVRRKVVSDAISEFLSCERIIVESDLLGAARSLCQDKPGIACIMGTGSNSCYYDGDRIAANVSPLGYILGDEGGGAVLGRKLVSAVLKKQVPREVIGKFFETYEITPGEILENVYMKPFPNRFLGQFSRFLHSNIEVPELRYIVASSFEEFIVRNVLQYPESATLQVHFTGSIAFHFRALLEEALQRHGLRAGNITLSPMANLIKYHQTIL